jgi:hypothetical protein
MKKSDATKVISKLKQATKAGAIQWERVATKLDVYNSDNVAVRNFIISKESGMYLYDNDYSKGRFDLTDSYYASYKDGFVYLFKFMTGMYDSYYFVALQSNKNAVLRLLDELEIEDLTPKESFEIFVGVRELALYASETIDATDDYVSRIVDEG